ncbi:hypothetical protein IFM89_007263 [Coptis chinensis]|uniref:Transposase MuDR plant domain-containing protein n=1 Tax=Coptis chinensis TaxID=261450 RepID=A0A835IKH4_9MAGN|nr:hypothetical protein IFM89_007263 [Coptis chinensis]
MKRKPEINIKDGNSKEIPRVHYGGSWSENPEVYGKFSAYDYTGGRSIVLDDVSGEGIFLDGWLLSILESIPNSFGYTINLVPYPLFLRNGVRIPVENDSDWLMMMREGDIDDTEFLNVFINFEEELDPIPPMVEDEDALIEEEYDVLNPNNINIDEIAPKEGYRSDESKSEGSEGYEPQHEEFEELTHGIIDEADGELPPVQIEIEEPYVGIEKNYTLLSLPTNMKRKPEINIKDGNSKEIPRRSTLDPIPPMVEDEDALIEEEYDVLNPNNINIDEIAPKEGYRSDESKSEGSEGYEPQHEEFEELTHGIIDEADGEVPPVQIEIEEPYVGIEWSTIQKCRTYLRIYVIANRFEFRGKKNDGDRVRLNYKREECTWMFYARASKSKKNDGLSDCNRFLDDLEKVDKKAVDWLKKRDVTTWCRSHFWTYTKSEHINNNFSESFNQWIMDLRDNPVCTFVEKLNLMLMTLMRKRRIKAMEMDINDVVPRVKAIHEKQIFFIKEYTYISAADHMFTVLGSHGSRWLVNLDAHELRAYVKTYSRVVLPIPNDKDWGKPITQVLPPSLKRQPRRPKKNRRKDADEQTQAGDGHNASQAGAGQNASYSQAGEEQNDFEPAAKPKQIKRCSKCHSSSHNIMTCPEQAKLNAETTQSQSATEAPQAHESAQASASNKKRPRNKKQPSTPVAAQVEVPHTAVPETQTHECAGELERSS